MNINNALSCCTNVINTVQQFEPISYLYTLLYSVHITQFLVNHNQTHTHHQSVAPPQKLFKIFTHIVSEEVPTPPDR